MTNKPMQDYEDRPMLTESERELLNKVANAITNALNHAKPHQWSTWDVWGGRVRYHEETPVEARRRVVRQVLEDFWTSIKSQVEGVPF